MRTAVTRWLMPLVRHRWFQAASVTAAVVALAAAVTEAVPPGGGQATRSAAACGLVRCGVSLPADAGAAPSPTVTPLAPHPRSLAPGATEVVPIFGYGRQTSPAGCTFDAAACRS
jgi:hypothetical protein